jgi:IS30 family transposase
MQDAKALGSANAFSTFLLNKVDAQMRLSLTYNQGREMAAHPHLTHITGMQMYFAHPHSRWERGINKNTNCLLGISRLVIFWGVYLAPRNFV